MEKLTTKLLCIIGAALLSSQIGFVSADAAKKQQSYWDKHEKSKINLINTWKEDRSIKAYSNDIFQLTKYETYLSSNYVKAEHYKLVGHLASGTVSSSYDYPLFVYKIFKYELKNASDFSPDVRGLFVGERFYISKK